MVLVFVIAGAVLIGIAVSLIYGRVRWRRSTSDLHAKLRASRQRASSTTVDLRETEGLPSPVARYFRTALRDGQPIIETMAAKQTGWFNMSEHGEAWKPFTATQQVVTRSRGFVWDARVKVAPGLVAFVWDAYVAGSGILWGTILGLRTVVHAEGNELSEGQLLRFLAEAPWYPTALLPSQGIRWEPVDARSAKATIDDCGLTVSVVFEFGDDGLPTSFSVEERGRLVDGASISTPWQGDYRGYQPESGMLIPREGEVRWAPIEEPAQPYWRGRMTSLSYEPGLDGPRAL